MTPEMHDLEPDEFFDFDDDAPAVLMLSADQRSALAAAVAAGLRASACDNTLRLTQQYAADAGLAWPPLRDQLQDNGGYCDCEVLFNVVGEEDVGKPN